MTDKLQIIKEWIQTHKLYTMDEHMKFYSDAAEAEYNALCNIEHFINSLQEEPSKIKSKCMYTNDNYTDEDRKVLCDGCEENCKYNKKESVSEIDFEQELYKAFGHVKDFTLCLKIARCFYEMGRKYHEPISEDLEKVVEEIVDPTVLNAYGVKEIANRLRNTICGTSVSEDLGEYINELSKQFPEVSFAKLSRIAVRVAKWQKQQDQSTIELAEDHAMLAGMDKMREQLLKNAITAEVRVVEDFMGTMTLRCFCDKYKQGDKVKLIIIKED